MATFSIKNDLKLVHLVSKQRDLYDPNSSYCKSINKRAEIWEEIATKFSKKGFTAEVCKKQWNKLKKSYDHFKKTGSVVTTRWRAKSKIFQAMTFLKVEKQQVNGNNRESNENQQKSNENQQQQDNENNLGPEDKNASFEVIKHQGNKITLGRKTTDDLLDVEKQSMEDELHLFFTTVRTKLGNLPRELQIMAQDEMLQVLSKYKQLALLSKSFSEASSKITE